jgi:hypothetical protein
VFRGLSIRFALIIFALIILAWLLRFIYTVRESSIAPERTLMVEEPSPLLPPVEESIEAETDTALEPDPESGEPATETTSEPGFVCGCDWRMRFACTGVPFYRAHEGTRYCALHYPGTEKRAEFRNVLQKKLDDNDFNFCGVWFPEPLHFRSSRFDTDANFSHARFSSDATFTSASFSANADFNSAIFNAGADFSSARFGGEADFSAARFGANADFTATQFSGDADFTSAKFIANAYFSQLRFSKSANFSYVRFAGEVFIRLAKFEQKANFRHAKFSAPAYFSSTEFDIADFSYAKLAGQTDFIDASFATEANFQYTTIEDYVRFSGAQPQAFGTQASVDFQFVQIKIPDHVSFHTLHLRPHWFVNVDPREFVFTDVDWEWERISINQEIAALESNGVSSPSRLLAIVCRQLAENAEANNRYEEASNFRYWAMDLARRTKWKGWSFWKTDWLHMLYWAVSGYGERILRALGVLVVLLVIFALLYTQVGFTKPEGRSEKPTASPVLAAEPDTIGQPLSIKRAWTYGLGVMSLQRPEPRPLTNWAHTLVTLETILGPVQAALLALAIRRKFMR